MTARRMRVDWAARLAAVVGAGGKGDRMDDLELIAKLKTPDDCERLIKNVEKTDPDLVRLARRRAVELRAEAHGAGTAAEREALQAVYAYEEALSKKNGRRTRASRTWQMIDRWGILHAVERAVNRSQETAGYRALVELDMQDFAFETVVVRYPDLFSAEAVARSKARMAEWGTGE